MKKCFYFPTWEEQKDVMISLDEFYISIIHKTITYETGRVVHYHAPTIHDLEIINKSIPQDPILAKLCELTGAKMYEDHVILDFFERNGINYIHGDLCYWNNNDENYDNNYFFESYLLILKEEKEIRYKDLDEADYNIFHEYSKFLRKEENKWEDVKKVLCI